MCCGLIRSRSWEGEKNEKMSNPDRKSRKSEMPSTRVRLVGLLERRVQGGDKGMTYEEAIKILHPDTLMGALAEIEYYNGFSGVEVEAKAIEDACLLACESMEKQQAMAWRPFKFDEDGVLVDVPGDGQEILVSYIYNGKGYVDHDTFVLDGEEAYLDSYGEIEEGMAWMPLPEPYKEERK